VIKQLVDHRNAAVDDLYSLLAAHQGLTDRQQQLFEGKLDYVRRKGRLESYAANFRDNGKIDAATYDRLIALATLTKPNGGLLVEYDTVLNQLLIYLHQWGVDPQTPLYARTLQLAEQQRQERRQAGASSTP
jgi:hypothetical protein